MPRPSLHSLVVAAGAIALGVAYSNHFGNGFHFDDSHTVVDNPWIRTLSNLPEFFRSAATFSIYADHQSYRPLVTASLALDYRIGGGLSPWAFHAGMFVLFLLQTWLVARVAGWIACRSGVAGDGRTFGAVVAFLSALHPATAETLNYVIARSDLISTAGIVASLSLWQRGRGIRRWGLHSLPAALGVFAKAPAAMYAPILFMHALLVEEGIPLTRLWERRRDVVRVVRSVFPAFLTCGAAFAFTESMHGTAMNWGGPSRLDYAATQAWIIVRYVGTFVLPIDLCADHDTAFFTGFSDPRTWAGLASLGLVVAGIVFTSTRAQLRPAAFGLGWFLLGLLPTSSVVPLAEARNDHRTFLGYIGLMLAVVTLASQGLACGASGVHGGVFRRIGGFVVVALMIAYAAGTWERNRVWRDEESLWADVVAKAPHNGRGLMNWGLTQMAVGRFQVALDAFERARATLPAYPYLEANLGIAKGALGRADDAEVHFRRAIELAPTPRQFDLYFARWLLGVGRLTEARLRFESALRFPGTAPQAAAGIAAITRDTVPSAAEAASRTESPAERTVLASPSEATFIALGLDYFRERRFVDAAQANQDALRIAPRSAVAWNNLGSCLGELGRFEEEITACQQALALDASHPTAANNILWARQQLASTTRPR